MEQGEHWFHTVEQMNFLDAWFMRYEANDGRTSERDDPSRKALSRS